MKNTVDNCSHALLGKKIAGLLEVLSQELKFNELWQEHQPSQEALASNEPFCIDTLPFEQWLQFIFIPRLSLMIKQGEALPNNIALLPMAAESFKLLSTKVNTLLNVIKKIDESMSQQ